MPFAKRAAAQALVSGWLVSLCVGFLPAAAVADAYTVRGIAVDVEAEDAVTARELAIEQAQRDGLRRLLERLTLPQYYGQLPAADEQALTRLISAYEVEQENLSATRYVGQLSVVYDEQAVQNLMQGTGVPMLVELPPSLLVVPVLDNGGTLEIFSGPDGWRNAWAAEAESNTLLDLQLPLGDLGDLRTLSAQMVQSEPEAALAQAAERHGTEAAIFLIARADDPSSPTRVTVTSGGSHGLNLDFPGDSLAMDGDAEAVWQAAVRRTKTALEDEWKAQNLIAMDQLAQLRVDVPIGTLDEWADIRRRLAEVAAIRRVDVEMFSQAEAELIVNHIGNRSQLQRALEARGLRLSEGASSWRLQRMAGQPAG